ncbi:hypothetical protein LCGC14_1287010, partial [marine sediment metagenome]
MKEIIDLYFQPPLLFQPGTKWNYSESMDVLALIMEKISEQPWEEFLRENLFSKLNMVDTGFLVPDSQFHRFGNSYKSENGKILLSIDYTVPERRERITKPPSAHVGLAGIYSSVKDIMNFSQMLLNNGLYNNQRILKADTVNM